METNDNPKPRGRASRWDDDALDRLSDIRPQDVEGADAWWEEHAPRGTSSILRARPTDPVDDEV